MDKVTVIQADREAAADIASIVRDQTFSSKHICDGLHDEHRVVQAFAKHRLATPAPDSEKLREAAGRVHDAVEADEHLDGIRINHSDALLILAALGASL